MTVKNARRRSLVAIWTLAGLTLVSAPSNAGATSSSRSHTATSLDWTVTLSVARTSARPGTSIPATLTVDNRSGRPIDIVGCPGTDYEIVAGSSKVPNSPVIPSVLCTSKIGPGLHIFHTKVQTMYVSCGGGAESPPCGHPPKLSPLPVGVYHTQLILPGATSPLPVPRAFSITLET
jgi:hypothetical protein